MKGDEEFTTDSKLLITKLNIKAKERDTNLSLFIGIKKYKIKLNKTNIKKIQKYIDEEGI